ncbi:MAG: DUF1318 domain-containing protein [Myxococcota bacterium]|jgi:hypothetical protein|nr:DUF1318 domain-containing protein [Myxococcota bacterium]
MRKTSKIESAGLLGMFFAGCISAPDVVLLDRKTVLEELASGELHPLENDLREEALVPRGVDYTRAELRESGADVSEGTLSSIVEIYAMLRTDAELVDELLVLRCVGESLDGQLVETPTTCSRRVNATRTSAMVQRANRARRQLWRYLEETRPDADPAALRASWRTQHLETVVCGAQLETERGWEVKRC